MRTGRTDHATFVGWVYRGMHVKIQLHPSRNDEMDEVLVGRRHPSHGQTKARPGGGTLRALLGHRKGRMEFSLPIRVSKEGWTQICNSIGAGLKGLEKGL